MIAAKCHATFHMTDLPVALAIAGLIRNQTEGGFADAMNMGGLAATLTIVWLKHALQWAKIAAIALLCGQLVPSSLRPIHILWPLVIVVVGRYLFFKALRLKIA
jgi:hypothetical protein